MCGKTIVLRIVSLSPPKKKTFSFTNLPHLPPLFPTAFICKNRVLTTKRGRKERGEIGQNIYFFSSPPSPPLRSSTFRMTNPYLYTCYASEREGGRWGEMGEIRKNKKIFLKTFSPTMLVVGEKIYIWSYCVKQQSNRQVLLLFNLFAPYFIFFVDAGREKEKRKRKNSPRPGLDNKSWISCLFHSL